MLLCHTELKGLREDAGAGGRYETLKADRTRETVALPLPECVALGMSCRPISLGLSFLKVKAVWSLSRRVSASIHYRWLLLLLSLLSLSSSSSDRQAKSLRPRTQNCSGFEHSSFGAATSGSKGADREVPVKTSGEKPIQSRRMPSKPSDVAYHHTNQTSQTGGTEVAPGTHSRPHKRTRCRRAPKFNSERPEQAALHEVCSAGPQEERKASGSTSRDSQGARLSGREPHCALFQLCNVSHI